MHAILQPESMCRYMKWIHIAEIGIRIFFNVYLQYQQKDKIK